MAITSGFFNSKNGDRKYNTVDISSMFEGIFADGIFKTIGANFAPKAGSGMNVTIGTGKAWFNKVYIKNDATHSVAMNSSDVLLDRIDAIVLEVNNTEAVRNGTIKYIAGTPASSPSKPVMTKSEQINQYPIAYVTIPHGSTSISQSNIEVMIGKSECPFAVGIIEGLEIDYVYAQWEAMFSTWFDSMKGQLSTDAAGNLQVQINNITDMIEVTLKANAWSDNTQAVTANGIKESSHPWCDIKMEGNISNQISLNAEWNKIVNIRTLENSLIFTASTTPTMDMTILVKGR